MRKTHALLISLLLVFIVLNNITLFNVLDTEREKVVIARVIDGDTIKLTDGRTLRLANINSPEKNNPLSESSKEFLENYTNKTIEIEIIEEDLYHRFVSRLYAEDYINLQLVSLGLASKAWVTDAENKVFISAEKNAIEKGLGIWEHSKYWGCFDIKIDAKKEITNIKNICGVSFSGLYIKDESRKVYKFLNTSEEYIELHSGHGEDAGNIFYWNSENVWNNDKDSAYIFDRENKIAAYYFYGY